MVENIEQFKELVKESLENNFINRKSEVEKDMGMMNTILSVFGEEGCVFTYDEYCQAKIKYEMEACDSLDVDFNSLTSPLTEKERQIIYSRVSRIIISDPEADEHEILKDEFSKWQADKLFNFEKKAYRHIIKYTNIMMVRERLGEFYDMREEYFDEMFDGRAKNKSQAIAEMNRSVYEEEIKNSIF